jgi:hypothetical protein
VHGNGYPLSGINIGLLTHEFGHKFNEVLGWLPANTLADTSLSAGGIVFQKGILHVSFKRSEQGYQGQGIDKPYVYHFVGTSDDGPGEDLADEFYNWVYQGVQSGPYTLGFADNPAGQARYEWIDDRMGEWIYFAAGR